MHVIDGEEFWKLIKPPVNLLVLGFIICFVSWCALGMDRENEKSRISMEARDVRTAHDREWSDTIYANATLQSWEAGSTKGIKFYDEWPTDAPRYAELAIRISTATSIDGRLDAYLDYKALSELPADTPYGIHLAIFQEDLTQSERYGFLSQSISNGYDCDHGEGSLCIVKIVSEEWVEGIPRSIVPIPDPPAERVLDEQKFRSNWRIYALIAYGLSLALLLLIFVRRAVEKAPVVIVSIHPMALALKLLFVPVFLLLYVGAGIWALVGALNKRSDGPEFFSLDQRRVQIREEIEGYRLRIQKLERTYVSLSRPHRDPPPSVDVDREAKVEAEADADAEAEAAEPVLTNRA